MENKFICIPAYRPVYVQNDLGSLRNSTESRWARSNTRTRKDIQTPHLPKENGVAKIERQTYPVIDPITPQICHAPGSHVDGAAANNVQVGDFQRMANGRVGATQAPSCLAVLTTNGRR